MKKLSIIVLTLVFTSLTFAQAPKGFEVDKSGAILVIKQCFNGYTKDFCDNEKFFICCTS